MGQLHLWTGGAAAEKDVIDGARRVHVHVGRDEACVVCLFWFFPMEFLVAGLKASRTKDPRDTVTLWDGIEVA